MRFRLSTPTIVAVAALASSIGTAPWTFARTAGPAQQSAVAAAGGPGAVYHRVWEIIHDTYYDPHYNGQNWSRWEHRYDGKLKTSADEYKAIDTMLTSLGDRYTRFLNPQAFKEENEQIAAKLYGIGIQMGYDRNHKIIVIAPIEGTPAYKAGLLPLDEIIEVNGKATQGMNIEAVSQMIRGPIDTEVAITILRNNKEKKTFAITRGEIPIRSVQKVAMLNSDIGYVRLTTFISQHANEEMREALTRLSPARGIVLDLRDNPGGLVTNAIDICNIFLDGGVIVSTVDRNAHKVNAVSNGKPFSRQPLVVLINQSSASASEITSGALHDNRRAQLVGTRSFGKGLVQAINKLPDGSGVNVTIARYLTPSGTDINKKGITPDYEVKLEPADYKEARGPWWLDPGGPTVKRSPEDMKDIQLKKAVDVLEAKIQNAEQPYELKLNFPGFGPNPSGLGGSY